MDCLTTILAYAPTPNPEICATAAAMEQLEPWSVGRIAEMSTEDLLSELNTSNAEIDRTLDFSKWTLEDQAEHCITIAQRFIVTQLCWTVCLQTHQS